MNEPMRFRKKPVEIEAILFNEPDPWSIQQFVGLVEGTDKFAFRRVKSMQEEWPEGTIVAKVWDKLHDTWVGVKQGQWIIRGVKGEYYPCDYDVFMDTYEQV